MFDTRTDSWRNDTGWLQLSWFRNSCYFNLFLLYFLKAERKKEKKQTTFTCASWKTKTIWVFRLNLKANSTERFVQQHHKTADKPVSKTERGTKKRKKNTRRHLPNCRCECQPECTCIWGRADGGRRGQWGEEASKDGGFTTTLYQTVPNTEQIQGPRWKLMQLSRRPTCSIVFSVCSYSVWTAEAAWRPMLLFSFLWLHLLFLALNSLVRYVHGIPSVCMHCFQMYVCMCVYVCVYMCVCLWLRSWLCSSMSRSHSKIFTPFHLP